MLHGFETLEAEARILNLSVAATIAAGWPVMAFAGMVYARLFGRAANDKRGGWLFGMTFGFALWAAGAVFALPLASGGTALAGVAALGALLSLVIWGAALGLLFPFIHRPMHDEIDEVAQGSESGPAAATKSGRLPGR